MRTCIKVYVTIPIYISGQNYTLYPQIVSTLELIFTKLIYKVEKTKRRFSWELTPTEALFSSAQAAALLSTSLYTTLDNRYHHLHDSISWFIQRAMPTLLCTSPKHKGLLGQWGSEPHLRSSKSWQDKHLLRRTNVHTMIILWWRWRHFLNVSSIFTLSIALPAPSACKIWVAGRHFNLSLQALLYSAFQLCLCNYMANQIFLTEFEICFRQNFQKLTLPNLVYTKGIKIPTKPFLVLPLSHQNQTAFPSVSSTCKIYSVLNKW